MRRNAAHALSNAGTEVAAAYLLGSHLSFVPVDGWIVVLDARADRYKALGSAASARVIAALANLSQPSAKTEIRETFRDLKFRGIDDPAIQVETVHLPTVTTDLGQRGAAGRPPASTRIAVFTTVWTAAGFLRFGGFEASLVRFQGRGISRPRMPYKVDPTHLSDLVSAFERTRGSVPVDRSCLVDSIALREFLWRDEIYADLVLGVRMQPFSAHCWLQHGTIALNERVDAIERLTPIRLA